MQRFVWFGLVVLLGCKGEGPAGADDDLKGGQASAQTCSASAESLSRDIFASACASAGCHGGAMAAAALDLSDATAASKLIGQSAGTCDGFQLVAPGDPDKSLLLRKVIGSVPSDCGDPMPPLGDLLAPEQIECIRSWIASLDPDAGVSDPNSCETCGESSCIDVSSDARHCGACGESCPSGATCESAACACPSGLVLCGDRCVDLARDAAHCGGCGKACEEGAVCTGGTCACGQGFASCDGGCAELATDPNHCGACGERCGPGKLCTPTGCGTQAACAGLTRCGDACVDVDTSLVHCGRCDAPCSAGQTCLSGVCACPNGQKSCNGTCVDATQDEAHCGACNVVCPQGTTCEDGACACPGGGAACGTECVDLKADERNCGACGKTCAPGQTCEAGSCACPSGSATFADDVAPVLDKYCTNAGCHAGMKAKASLDLTLSKSYAELVNVKATQCSDGRLLVAPNMPSNSYLMQKLLGVDLCSGTQMPKAGVSIPAQDLEAISAWICRGAAR